jgi:hypothetical protein
MAPSPSRSLAKLRLHYLILRNLSPAASSSPHNTTSESPNSEPSQSARQGVVATIPMIAVMVIIVLMLMLVCIKRDKLLLTGNSLCLWLRKCVDARDFEAARKVEATRRSARLDRLERVSKSQTLSEWKESRSATTTEDLVWYAWFQASMSISRLSD